MLNVNLAGVRVGPGVRKLILLMRILPGFKAQAQYDVTLDAPTLNSEPP